VIAAGNTARQGHVSAVYCTAKDFTYMIQS